MCIPFCSRSENKKEKTDFYFLIYQTFLLDFLLYAYLINLFIHSSADNCRSGKYRIYGKNKCILFFLTYVSMNEHIENIKSVTSI